MKKNKTQEKENKFKDVWSKHKKGIIIGLGVVIVLVIAIVLIVCLTGNSKDNQEELLTNKLAELTKDFYEDKYYPNLISKSTGTVMSDEEKKEFAQAYAQSGISISLDSLSRLYGEEKDEIIAYFVNDKGEACDVNETKIVIYPKEPYDVNSYTYEITLACGFEEK